jgi:predicted nucleotidyltransferase
MFREMIENYLARLKDCKFNNNNNIDIKSVILFGSVARGQAKEHSDIDLIVVASGLPELKRRDELPPFRSLARVHDIWMHSWQARCSEMTGLRPRESGWRSR